MPLVALNWKVTDGITGQFTKRHLSTAAKETNRFAATYWQEKIMPLHFHGATQQRYNIEPRTELYRRVIKQIQGQGEGRFAMLQKTGVSFRFAKYFSRITATQYQGLVRINVPSYFANPKTGVFYENGKRKQIARQPKMSAELTDTISRDVKEVNDRATDFYATYFTTRAPKTTRTKHIT